MKLIKLRKQIVIMSFFGILSLITPAYAQNYESELQPLKNRADSLLYTYQIFPALIIYQQITDKEPDFANCYYNMAICYSELKQYEKAYQALKKFVKLKPKDCEAYFNMGMMQVYLGNAANARTLLLKARGLNPSTEMKHRIQDALDHVEPCSFSQESLKEVKSYLEERGPLTGSKLPKNPLSRRNH